MTDIERLEAYSSIVYMRAKAKIALINYLADHEADIALDIEDFGTLAPVFYELVGRPAGDQE